MKNNRRIRPRLLILLWIWAACMFMVVDLFRNVDEFDGVRPGARWYRAARYAAHTMVHEPYHDGGLAAARPQRRVDRAEALRRALGAADEADSFDALLALARGDGDPRVRIRALRRLAAEHADRARELVLALARDDSESMKVRAQAARSLGRTGGAAMAGLDELARTAPPKVQRGAWQGYADLGTAAAARALLEAGANDELGRIANPAAIPVLAAAARENAPACRALGNTRSREAVAPLTDVLADRSVHPTVRAAAAESLGRLGDDRALEALLIASDDPHRTVVRAARRAQQRIRR